MACNNPIMGMKLYQHSLNPRASNKAMKRCLQSKIHQDFQHLFKADLISLTDTPTLALHSTT